MPLIDENKLDLRDVFFEVTKLPKYAWPNFFLKKQEESGWYFGVYFNALIIAYENSKLRLKIDRNKHLVLESGHPSPMSANQGKWFESRHFSKTNAFLESRKIKAID